MTLRKHQALAVDGALQVLEQQYTEGSRLDVLEVGGGSRTKIDLPGTRIVSLDIDGDSLARSAYAEQRIVGDAQSYDFAGKSFDIAVFWNVLEHIPDPQMALRNVASCVAPAGSIVVAGPLLGSLKGIVTRVTPHWVHVLYFRVIAGKKDAGTPGQGPFKVEHHKGCDIDELVDSLKTLDFDVSFRREYRGVQLAQLNEFSRLLYGVYRLGSWALRRASRGKLGSVESDFILVARRRSHAHLARKRQETTRTAYAVRAEA
jgi:SAM-dependent methyltransferase